MSIFSDIVSSFYSSSFYGDVAHARRGIGMKFIAALTLVITLLITGYLLFYSADLNRFAAEIPKFAGDLPAVTIKDGKFSIDKPVPYRLPIGDDKERVWIYVDTNYKANDLQALRTFMETNKIAVLITADEFIALKTNKNTLEVKSFRDFNRDFTITHEDWVKFGTVIAEKGVNFLIGFALIGGLIGFFIYNLLATFAGAMVMMLIALIARANLEFGATMRLTAAAQMPFNAIVAAPLMLGGSYIIGMVSWLIWLGYLVFAVVSSKRQTL